MTIPYIGLSALLFVFATSLASAESALLRFDGIDIDRSELSAGLRNQLFEAEMEHYRQLQSLLEQAALERFIADEAERQQQSIVQVRQALFAVKPPSEDEIKVFYEQNKARIRESFDEIKNRIGPFLMSQQREALQQQLIVRLRDEGRYQSLLQRPQAPVVEIATEGFPSKGAADAKVTVVEFADYRCGHCINAYLPVQEVIEQYAEQVRLVFMDLPVIRPQQVSGRLAIGGSCAAAQDKFWDYHDLAFEQQGDLNADSPLALAQELELDMTAFASCLDSDQAKAQLAKSQAQADQLGVTGTPTFFVNGQKLFAEDLSEGLKAAIDAALAKN